MYSVDENIKENIKRLNVKMEDKYKDLLAWSDGSIKEFISEEIGPIIRLDKSDIETLNSYEKQGGIVGVDGSVNRKGSSYPHYVELFKGLAKSTKKRDDRVSKVEIYSPILEEEMENILDDDIQEERHNKRDLLLAQIELEVALESIERLEPYAILMDGSLIRYSIYANDLWLKLRYECEKRGILLVGVIEEIKTNIIGERLFDAGIVDTITYDKEILFGRLDYGEMIKIDDSVNKKHRSAEISSIFMRTSKSPSVIGMDIIDIQRSRIEEMASLVFALTPENSRGIPIWLDIIDKEVKISNSMLDAYLESYMDREIYERFFLDMRSRRT